MKKIVFTLNFLVLKVFLFAQVISFDTSNVTFYNTLSAYVCSNQPLDIDLNGDSIYDLTIRRNNSTSSCYFAPSIPLNYKHLGVSLHGGFKILANPLSGAPPFPEPLILNQLIDLNNYSFVNYAILINTATARHCVLHYFGIQNGKTYYMLKDSVNNTHYGIEVSISQSGDCFQILGTNIVTGVNKDKLVKRFYATMEEDYLNVVSIGEITNKQITIVGLNGQIIDQFENAKRIVRRNVSNLSSGIYIIRVLDKSSNQLESHKIFKAY